MATPRVPPVVPQCIVLVLSNISSESKLYSSTTDLGKLSSLSCSKINISTVPCVVSREPCLLSPTSKTYVYPVAEPHVSPYYHTFVSPAAEPPVATPSAFDDSSAPIVVAESFALLVADPTAPSDLSASAEPFVPKLFHHHQYKPD